MDFQPNEEQQAVLDLAQQIISDHTQPERLRDLESDGRSHHDQLWSALVDADLVGLALPEDCGGGGFGLLEATLVAESVGEYVAPVPFVEVVAAGRCLARAGDPFASEVVGGRIVVPALREDVDARETAVPDVRAVEDGGWRLSGQKRLISGATAASMLLVSARTDDATPALFLVEPDAVAGWTDSISTAGQLLRSIDLDGTPGRRIDSGEGALDLLLHELRVLRCAHLAGIARGALHHAAEHCKVREQFGSPIGTFQAVAHRMADAWLDANLVEATTRQAAWRTDHGLPANQAASSAALWACEGAQRVVHAAQHVHGGIGVDLDYPVHRFFRWAKDVELQLGGAGAAARDLGAAIASEPLTIG